MKKISWKKYFDRVYGCFLGKTVIGTLGAPFEGIKMPLDLPFKPEMINTMLPNDDLDLQILWLDVLNERGENFTSLDLLRRFCDCCAYDPGEYAIMRKNYKRGIYPPLSGKFSNDFYINGMGCPIRSEIWACINPLDPAKAADFSSRDGVLDHAGDSVYGERFFAAMEAAAFEESDLGRLIEIGLEYVPAVCRFRDLVNDTVALCNKYDDYKIILRKLLYKYGHPDCTNLYQNIGITLIALLKGDLDMIKTGMMALNCGFDTDCTCATAGALIGVILGAERIIEQYGWSDIRYAPGVKIEEREYSVKALSDEIARLGAHLSKNVTGAPAMTYAFTPSQYPLTFSVEYENDDPTFSPVHSCRITLKVGNISDERITSPLSLTSDIFLANENIDLAPGESKEYPFTVEMPADTKVIRDKNIITARYVYRESEQTFDFGVVGAMPWKVIGPIWKTDPVCTTEQLIAADLKYGNIIKAVEYDGCRTDVTRRFHLNFAIDTDTEYMTFDECFAPYDSERTDTKYEESVYYQKEDTLDLGDVMGFRGPSVVYMARELIVDDDRTLCVQIGQSSPFELYINGTLAAKRNSCDTFDAENAHLTNVQLSRGINRILLRLTRVNNDAKYTLFFSKRHTCGEHYVDMSAVRPEFFGKNRNC